MTTTYADSLTLSDARRCYFEENRFGDDGGYSAKWVDVKVGPLPFRFPNTQARVRALRFHDLHHVVTGYRTNWAGEVEISAWELASGCADHHAARVIDLFGVGFGVLHMPRKILRAIARGRRTKNLYRATWNDALLQRTVGEMRRELGFDHEKQEPARIGDIVAFAGWSVAGLVAVLVGLALLPLMPLIYLALRFA